MEEANNGKRHIGFLLMEFQFKILEIEKFLIKNYSVLKSYATAGQDKKSE